MAEFVRERHSATTCGCITIYYCRTKALRAIIDFDTAAIWSAFSKRSGECVEAEPLAYFAKIVDRSTAYAKALP
jgi:hypothetical protein